MKKYLFSNGDRIDALGLGTWLSKKGEVYEAIREAIRIGYRHFDCAFIYGNEKEIGQAIRDAMFDGEVSRGELWITSKLWNTSHKKLLVQPAIDKALEDLKLDYLDLYLMHWPVALKKEAVYPFEAKDFYNLDEVPLAETWAAIEALQYKGYTRHIGVSNFSVKKLKLIIENTGYVPEVNQIEMHPYLQQKEMLEYCRSEGILLTAYSPLGARGNALRPGETERPDLFNDPVILSIAANHDCHPSQVILQWAIARGTVAIPKSVNPERLKSNFDAANLELSTAEMEMIAGLDRHHRFIKGDFWTPLGSPYTLENLWDE